jgi:hypothetical protein
MSRERCPEPINTPQSLGVTPHYVLQHNAISRSVNSLSATAKKLTAMAMALIPPDLSNQACGGIGIMKTVQDYMKDPRILNDNGLMDGPEEIRVIHASRLKIQDEIAGMSTKGRIDFLNRRAAASLAKMGMHIFHTMQENGQLKTRTPATV